MNPARTPIGACLGSTIVASPSATSPLSIPRSTIAVKACIPCDFLTLPPRPRGVLRCTADKEEALMLSIHMTGPVAQSRVWKYCRRAPSRSRGRTGGETTHIPLAILHIIAFPFVWCKCCALAHALVRFPARTSVRVLWSPPTTHGLRS